MYVYIYNMHIRFICYVEVCNVMLDRNKAYLVNNRLKEILLLSQLINYT